MSVLISGASGFIGSAVVAALTRRGDHVGAVARRPSCGGRSWYLCTSWIQADLRTYTPIHLYTYTKWSALLEEITTIYHFAWSSQPATSKPRSGRSRVRQHRRDPSIARLLEAVKARFGIRFVLASSGWTVYGLLQASCAAETHPTIMLAVEQV